MIFHDVEWVLRGVATNLIEVFSDGSLQALRGIAV